MPVRRDGDKRESFENWDSWIEKTIAEAQQAGEFDNLPGQGKPLEIQTTAVNPEWDLAFSRLHNAGVAPAWMELDREIRKLTDDLDGFLEQSCRYLDEQLAAIAAREAEQKAHRGSTAPATDHLDPWWRRWRSLLTWLRFEPSSTNPAERELDRHDLLVIRNRMRDQYLARAAELNTKIIEFNNTLSRNLWHLERMRLTPDRAAHRFDEAIPPLFTRS